MQSRRRRVVALGALGVLGSLAAGPPRAARAASTPVLTRVETALGSFVIAVDPAVAPITVANYLALVDGHHLDGGSAYRIVTLANQDAATRYRIEVVQWGMHLDDKQPAPFPPIAHETTRQTGLLHRDGTVSMARNAPGSAGTEFFVCIGDQPELDYGGRRNPDGQGFAAFGQVVSGGGVVRALHARGTNEQFLAEPIAVVAVRRLKGR